MICLNFIKNLFLSFIIIFFITNYAQAKCNFDIIIGEDISNLKKELARQHKPGSVLTEIYSPAQEFCPNENFDEKIYLNFTFIESELASIRIIARNNKENITTNKLLLMNYAKNNYGDFDTGQNPKTFNSFKVWNDGIKLIVYKRILNHLRIFEEEIYITNNEYQTKIDKVNALKESGRLRN